MSKWFLIAVLCAAVSLCLAQGSAADPIRFKKSEYRVSPLAARNPPLLVQELTRDKTSDEEKFKALFGWVATHISYNYREYYSTGGSPVSIRDILHHRRAICLGYANLMDSLCKLAGITNVTVYGYAKDEIFDVQDSLYMDNHAWNAVKLDGQWYVYDVTWSTGHTTYKLSRFGEWIRSQVEKHPVTYKRKKYRRSIRRFFTNDCNKAYSGPVYYYKPRFLNVVYLRFLYRLTRLFPLRLIESYDEETNADYYLSDPGFFAITHCPDDPLWSLGAIKSIRQFEKDSAYYYLTDSTGRDQVRGGRDCSECDDYVSLTEAGKLKFLHKNSNLFNKRNAFISTNCDFMLGKESIINALAENDTLSKIKHIDTALICLSLSRKDMLACKKTIPLETSLQKKKNKKKQNLQFGDSKKNVAYIKSRTKKTKRERSMSKETLNKELANATTFRDKTGRIGRMSTRIRLIDMKETPQKKIDKFNLAIENNAKVLDSLIAFIGQNRPAFDSLTEHLYLNIWPQAFRYDTIMKVFEKRTRLRRRLGDDYNRGVVELTRKADSLRSFFNKELDTIVFGPNEKINDLFNRLNVAIKRRQQLESDNLRLKKQLALLQVLSKSELDQYKQDVLERLKEDYCWTVYHVPRFYTIERGFALLESKQRDAEQMLDGERAVERERYIYITKELDRRYKKHNNIVAHNLKLVKTATKALSAERRDLQKSKK